MSTPSCRATALVAAILLCASVGCRTSSLLDVPTPAGVVAGGALRGAAGAEALRAGAEGAFSAAFGSFNNTLGSHVGITGSFTDEFDEDFAFFGPETALGARDIELSIDGGGGNYTATDIPYKALQKARLSALLASQALEKAGQAVPSSEIAETFALAGYAELLLAEDYCAGVPLSTANADGTTVFGQPLTTDSLLGDALAKFDSALAHAGTDTIGDFARIGRARALMNRGRYAAAEGAADSVRTGFTFVAEYQAGNVNNGQFYADLIASPIMRVAERKGVTGVNFVSAADRRAPIDSSLGTDFAGNTFYYPAKFPTTGTTLTVAGFIEARLMSAEAHLSLGDSNGWAAILNTLRQTAITPAMDTLTSDSTATASPDRRLSVMFRERALWLFGEGHRLGDLRRLVRQYGRDQSVVFPSGPYPYAGIPGVPATFGTDVTFPIQAVEAANPNFHGCLDRKA